MDKVHMVQKKNDGAGVVFATGTPITNSITDAFIMQMYLQSGELARLDGKARDANPQLGARDRGADKDRQHQQNDADNAKGVLVAHDYVEVLNQRERPHHQRHRDNQDDEL